MYWGAKKEKMKTLQVQTLHTTKFCLQNVLKTVASVQINDRTLVGPLKYVYVSLVNQDLPHSPQLKKLTQYNPQS